MDSERLAPVGEKRLQALPTFRVSFATREEQILLGLEQGLLYEEIKDRLSISIAKLKKLQHGIFRKLGAQNRTEAVKYWRDIKDCTFGGANDD